MLLHLLQQKSLLCFASRALLKANYNANATICLRISEWSQVHELSVTFHWVQGPLCEVEKNLKLEIKRVIKIYAFIQDYIDVGWKGLHLNHSTEW